MVISTYEAGSPNLNDEEFALIVEKPLCQDEEHLLNNLSSVNSPNIKVFLCGLRTVCGKILSYHYMKAETLV